MILAGLSLAGGCSDGGKSAGADAASSEPASDASSPTIDATMMTDGGLAQLAGHWIGTWTSSPPGTENGTVIVDAMQTDQFLMGTEQMAGSVCFDVGDFTGIVMGEKLRVSFVSTKSNVLVQGVAASSWLSITGTFEVTSGDCRGNTGTMALERR